MTSQEKIDGSIRRTRNLAKTLSRDGIEELAGQLDELADELREEGAKRELQRINDNDPFIRRKHLQNFSDSEN